MIYSCRASGCLNNYRFGEVSIREEVPSGARALILVHGFRNDEATAFKAYDTVWANIQKFGLPYDHLVKFSWPCSGLAVGFLAAVGRANKAGKYLADCIQLLQSHGCTVSVQTHSLGARPLLSALKHRGVSVHDAVLLAAAVDDDVFSSDGEFSGVQQAISHRLIVGYSTGDGVLEGAYWTAEMLSNLFSGTPRTALGLRGPKEILPRPGHLINASAYVHGHGAWKNAEDGFKAWGDLVA